MQKKKKKNRRTSPKETEETSFHIKRKIITEEKLKKNIFTQFSKFRQKKIHRSIPVCIAVHLTCSGLYLYRIYICVADLQMLTHDDCWINTSKKKYDNNIICILLSLQEVHHLNIPLFQKVKFKYFSIPNISLVIHSSIPRS